MSAPTDIAVIGVGARFPDAPDATTFWANIAAAAVAMREVDEQALAAAGIRAAERTADFVPVAARLPSAADFAAEFFGYSPAEAETIDPQQRLFLEVCHEALEAAGQPSRPGGPVTGVFAGCHTTPYSAALLAAKAGRDGWLAAFDDMALHLGGLGDFLTARVGYKLGLRGPTVGVQTACSSALYAVHLAVLSLLSGETDIALAGGATVLDPMVGYRYEPGGVLSRDGYCRAFDASSTGTVFSSGVGVVALRRLGDALADGDPVLAVVKGSAVGNDGADRPGFTAPSPGGVASVVSAALSVAGVSADQLAYVEAHGTGTALGDQIELRGLIEGTRASTSRTGFARLGSVKANIGHTGPAAGIAGLIKAVEVVRTGALPPHPLFETPRHPGLLAESPFHLSAEPGTAAPDPHALVNSMGFGGTNAVVVLGPPPAPTRPSAPATDRVRLVLSARTRTELDAMSKRLADVLAEGGLPVGDVAHTLRVGRASFDERRVVTAEPGRLAAALRLPRPPLVRTQRATAGVRVAVVAPEGVDLPADLLARLAIAFRSAPEVLHGDPEVAPANGFTAFIGYPNPITKANGHALALPATEDAVDELVTAAWLFGVDVDWSAIAGDTGRRVVLPGYPMVRKRYWALDRITTLADGGVAPAAEAPKPAAARVTETGDPVEADLLDVWREVFGVPTVGLDDEFGALGGTSLMSVGMVLAVQQRHGVLVNLHRAGGSQATVRRVAEIVRTLTAGGAGESEQTDAALIDADLALPLGELAAEPDHPRPDLLLTGATGFVGSFLLHELLLASTGRVYCLVRAKTEDEGWERLRASAAKYALPTPDRDRVHVVPGDLADFGTLGDGYRGGELVARVGRVVHGAARVIFTEPYRVLREDNVLPMLDLVRWMRGHGIRDIGFVSTLAATHYALGSDRLHLETRDQPLDPKQGGYGTSKWVGERLLERAERDGMRVRVFRPGFILGSTSTGACNASDLIWPILGAGLVLGAHPVDDRILPMAPIDVVTRAIAELSLSEVSVGRAYHLVAPRSPRQRRLFTALADAGRATKPMELGEWKRQLAERAVATGSALLSTAAALYDLEANDLNEDDVEAAAWQPWLAATGLSPEPTGDVLDRGLRFLAEHEARFTDLAPPPVHLDGVSTVDVEAGTDGDDAVLGDLLGVITSLAEEPITVDTDLFDRGVMSSLLSLDVVVHIETAYGVRVSGEDLDRENFRTVRTAAALVRKLREEVPA
ncbi:thioester reductase domain-containing protein [Actinokineospora diospyrosa]|uniref:Thioester reductase domain-containing protein n=1 Tax=Actinokineospora diospyrosa TaxID=103728 RepID=A0ABT1I5X6_9PSEU|nr:thioester reductase domain-containing protein [Actinokineospora diospyrosa]MCP2268022.1 thioester reductase domain-containing protein [Actinokineospora diospyrosa]